MQEPAKYRVLIAEDDYLVCEEIVRSVKKIGYEHIGSATNGNHAIKMVKDLKPDLVLMDIQMPEMDGLTASRIIQENHPTPIVILTAHDSIEMIQKAATNGIGAFLTKPPKPDEIERAAVIAISRHRDYTELQRLNKQLEVELGTRKKTELQLKHLLKEKEMLIKEVHHRVKNNFMIISSLLNLQANQINDTSTRDILMESHNRIKTMALIHEKLYQSKDFTQIDFKTYISNLISSLYDSYAMDINKVNIQTQIDNIVLDINRAIPVGLVINELLTNALKHAFPPDYKETGLIHVSMNQNDEHWTLTVQDNGMGLPADYDPHKSQSLGMRLVHILVQNQLDGSIVYESDNGTKIILTIPK